MQVGLMPLQNNACTGTMEQCIRKIDPHNKLSIAAVTDKSVSTLYAYQDLGNQYPSIFRLLNLHERPPDGICACGRSKARFLSGNGRTMT